MPHKVMDERTRASLDPDALGAPPPIARRRWEAAVTREEIAVLLAERRWQDLLARLAEARARWPKDLELLRSMRVLEDYVATRASTK